MASGISSYSAISCNCWLAVDTLRSEATIPPQQWQRFAEIGWLEGSQAGQLTSAYFGWRSIEHRLQYWQDAHTHSLPRQLEELEKFAAFAGFHLLAEFTAHLDSASDRIHRNFQPTLL